VTRATGKLAHTHVLLFSTEPPDKLEELARSCGADGWIQKTSDTGALVAAVRRWTGRPRGTPTPARQPAILFVDPDQRMRAYYRDTYSTELSRVEFLSSAAEALARARSSRPPDLVVAEVAMPGMTGADLYRRLAEDDAAWTKRFVFVTGAAARERWVARFLHDIDAPTLTNPVSRDHLRAAIDEQLRRGGGS
jgi:CheY-like chemotaxis protein